MKIFTLRIFILLLFFQTARAQVTDTIYIDCPGIIGGTWTPQNRYIARCNLLLPHDSVLTIQPGVQVEIQDGFIFKVEGQLNAVGSSSNRISIKPNESSWKGMSFGTPSGVTEINTSLLAYTDIDCGSSSGISEAVVLGKHKIVSLNNLRLSNAGKAIKVTGSADIDNIKSCEFTDVTQGIVYQFCDVVPDILIQNCTFSDILERAVIISQNQAFLDNISISGCDFNNSGLANNNAQSAIYITVNNKLTEITLTSNTFNAFSRQEDSPACIYIYDNEILDKVTLSLNEITLCGGEEPTSPNADFGGLYINRSQDVILDENVFSNNTGKKSGAGYLDADRLYFDDNSFLTNRNNYTGTENYGGAITILAGERIDMTGDSFDNNFSAKSGGALYIKSGTDEIPIDLIFNDIDLSSNSASNEGGAALINAKLDSLYLAGAQVSGNSSSAGSGGCFSIITSMFNDLTISSNTLQDNHVSATSAGGFLFLRHDPSIVPEYGNFSFSDNQASVTGHDPVRNYSLVYSKIKSFPQSISMIANQDNANYPVTGNLYHFELLTSGPEPQEQEVQLVMTGNIFQDNKCPLFFFSNDYASINGDFQENSVEGDEESFGTFITLECLEAPVLNFTDEAYIHLVSDLSGGAVSVTTVKEIGMVNFSGVVSQNCFSVEGDGGHFALVSGSSDAAMAQAIIVLNSSFGNNNTVFPTEGNGGGIYYKTPGNVDSIMIRHSEFYDFEVNAGGGAIYVDSKEIGIAGIEGSEFSNIMTHGGDGAICLYAGNGNITELYMKPIPGEETRFIDCIAFLNGGAVSARASKEIGRIVIESVFVDVSAAGTGDGGHFSLVSQGSDAALSQDLIINNCFLEGGFSEPYGNKGGSIYYSSPGNLDSLLLAANYMAAFYTGEDGGALYLEAKEIAKVSLLDNTILGALSLNAYGGALNIQATNGNIGVIENTGNHFQDCHAKLDGGAAYIRASKEIGSVTFDSVLSESCYAINGSGGHFAMISAASEQALAQQMIILNSDFHNAGNNETTGGDGGAIYYSTPGDLDSLYIRSSQFTKLKAEGNAGAICFVTRETDAVTVLGSVFAQNTSLDTAGSVYLHAVNGNIGKIRLSPLNSINTSFTSSVSNADGGALCAVASKEIGLVSLDSLIMDNCNAEAGNGGHFSLISSGTDPALVQKLSISGSAFGNSGVSNITGKNGGFIFYSAASDVASVEIHHSSFNNVSAIKDGGSLFIHAGKIDALDVNNSLFSSSVSAVNSGGAIFISSGNGLINGNLTLNRFINCTSGEMGGSLYIEDGKYDNTSENVNLSGNLFRKEMQMNMPETGGAVYCKGINAMAFVSDSSISQAAGLRGGFIYMEKVYRARFDSLYAYGNSAASGGVICHIGDEQASVDQSSRIFKSAFLFNSAGETGGCLYITDIDSVEIGRPDYKNSFVANQSNSAQTQDLVGGGVLFIQGAERIDLNTNSFYVNKSLNNGGIGLLSNVSDSIVIANNNFLSNKAKAGGAFTFINSFAGGVIANNNFSHNTSSEQGGAMLFSPSNQNSFLIRDNTFFQNNTGKLGGAIASYRPVMLKRNLFRENHLVDVNQGMPHKGTTMFLSGNGNQSVLKNCVFDQNYYTPAPEVASVYFDNLTGTFPEFNIANCSFFNYRAEHLSIFNDAEDDTVHIQNSIFTVRQDISRDDAVVYFNETVKCHYCDLIYSQINDTINHNVDEYVYFNVGDYYFDSTQYPVDTGNPDPSFNDYYMPPAYGTRRNDLGISGGPDNPDTNGIFIFHEPVNLPTNFDVVVVAHNCFTYTFECRGPFVNNYEYFYWFMPDSIITTQDSILTYTFSPDTYGNINITALGHDLNNAEVYGYGQNTINLDIIRLYSVSTDFGNNTVDVPSVPYTITIHSEIYVEDNSDYEYEWAVTQSIGVDYSMQTFPTSCIFEISKITETPAYIDMNYRLSKCGRTLDSTITIYLQPSGLYGCPLAVFTPAGEGVIDSTSFFIVEFDRILLKANDQPLQDADLDEYVIIDRPPCEGLNFRKFVTYTPTKTIFRFEQYNENTQLPGMLCNGSYTFGVKTDLLFTQFYMLNCVTDTKSYTVCCNDINDITGGIQANVYPNPFRNNLHIDFESKDDYFLEISDLHGQIQKSGFYAAVNEVNLNLEPLSDGIYILRVANSKGNKQFYLKINKITH
jgi:hypothetical protein